MEAERELRRELDALAKKRAALDAPTSGLIGSGRKNMLARVGGAGGSRDSPRGGGGGGAGFRNGAARTVLKENSFDDNQRTGGKRGNSDRAVAVSKRQRLQSGDDRNGRAGAGAGGDDDAENTSERKKRAVAPYTQKDTMARSRRMFGALMGHLGKAKAQIERDSDLFKRQDSKQHEAEQREKNQSKTLEEKAKRDAAVHRLEKLIARTEVDKAEQLARLRLDHLQNTRKNANLAKFLQTVASPPIFYLPAKHTKETEDLLDVSKEAHKEKLLISVREHETRLCELEAEFTSKLEKLREQLDEAKQEAKKKSETSSSESVAKSGAVKEADAEPQGSVDNDEVVVANDADKETDDKEQNPEGKEEQGVEKNEKTVEDTKPDVSIKTDDSEKAEIAADSVEENAMTDEKTEVKKEEPSTEAIEAEAVAKEEPMEAAASPAPAVPKKLKVDMSTLKVTELREELKKRGLDAKGLKASLVVRLEEAMEQEEAA